MTFAFSSAALAEQSEKDLVSKAKEDRIFDTANVESILVLLDLADTCNFEELMRWCVAAAIRNWQVNI